MIGLIQETGVASANQLFELEEQEGKWTVDSGWERVGTEFLRMRIRWIYFRGMLAQSDQVGVGGSLIINVRVSKLLYPLKFNKKYIYPRYIKRYNALYLPIRLGEVANVKYRTISWKIKS